MTCLGADGFGCSGWVLGCSVEKKDMEANFCCLCLFLFVLTNTEEGRGEESRGDGDDADADNQDKEGKDASSGGDGVDIAIAHGGKGADGPPEGFEDRGEMFGLGLIFKEIDADSGEVEDDDRDRAEENDFLTGDDEGAAHALHGGAVFGEFKDADEAEEAEGAGGAQVKADHDVEG